MAVKLFRREVRRLTLEGKPPTGRELDMLIRFAALRYGARMDKLTAQTAHSFAQTQGTRLVLNTLRERRMRRARALRLLSI